jgi:hypothetical protein
MIERERQRGIRKHWSYDLNRHIALKQALDKLRETASGAAQSRPGSSAPEGSGTKQNGARRRRRKIID